MNGPLHGVKIVELAGVGPGPFCSMMLSDMGADVVRIDRASFAAGGADPAAVSQGLLGRGRRSIGVDLKHAEGVELLLDLIQNADGLIEGYRPGVAERLGFGPEVCLARNLRLVYGRMTGWGQEGPLAHTAGHDVNYLAVSGVLGHLGAEDQPPIVPLPLIGDFAGGAMFLAYGMVCALFEAARTGLGQVVDAAVVDGSAMLSGVYYSHRALGIWDDRRGVNFADGGAHFYNVYECADGRYISVGAYEPQFYAELLRLTGLDSDPDLPEQHDRSQWPAMKARLAVIFKERSRDEWCASAEDFDACVAPVLTFAEAPVHPYNTARGTFVPGSDMAQPAPAPRLSRTPGGIAGPPPGPGQHTDEVLTQWLGLPEDRIARLRGTGTIA